MAVVRIRNELDVVGKVPWCQTMQTIIITLIIIIIITVIPHY